MASTVMPSGTVRRYHGRSFSSGSTRCSFGVSEYTNLTSSAAGLGSVNKDTTMLTMISATNPTVAARNAVPWPGKVKTPARLITHTVTALSVPTTRPDQPACGVERFQNMPRINVANNGALKNPNNVCK